MNAAEISAELALQIEALTSTLIGQKPSSRTRTELRFGSKGSLAVAIAGLKRGRWFDFETGAGGDALSLVAHIRRCSLGEALHWARDWLGDPAAASPTQRRIPTTPKPARDDARDRIELARRIWHESQPLNGSLAERYLASRGLRLPASEALRYHSRCPFNAERYPALVGLMTDPLTGEFTGIHRTALAADGSGKAAISAPKRMLGQAGIVRLSPDETVTYGLGISEGIETSISVLQTGWSPIWACCSAGAISRFPVLSGVESLTIFADSDEVGLRAANACCERWADAGRECQIIVPRAPGADLNDIHRQVAA